MKQKYLPCKGWGRWQYLAEVLGACSLAEKNFTLLHMRDELVGVPLLGTSFTGHLPVLEEITVDNLQYDVRDAQQVSPPAVVRLFSFAPLFTDATYSSIVLFHPLSWSLRECPGLQLVSRTMGCSPPKELSQEWPLHWDGCNYIPEDLHPKSFRGYFGHNTNVWATHNTSSVQVMSVAHLVQKQTVSHSQSLGAPMIDA